ncbi:MAG: MaoC family dehydratase N-terminal domain-containing protein [Acidimicrobiia bacterium]|nr:MaoC family dehydratase N-terminal domain-containing protein [Acidimicrobiia bacterium]
MTTWPETIDGWLAFEREDRGEVVVERGFIDHWLEATQDGNPLYWDETVAEQVAGGVVAPPNMMLTWLMAWRWSPRRPDEFWDPHVDQDPDKPRPRRSLETHFALKDFMGLKEGIVGGYETEFHEPVRLGDRLRCVERVTDIGEERTNRLGTGRSWTVEVRYFNQHDQLVGIARYQMYSYNREG